MCSCRPQPTGCVWTPAESQDFVDSMIRNVCANAWVCDRLHVKKYVMPTKLHLGFVGILENACQGTRCKASTPVKLPLAISGRLVIYGWMWKKAGKNKLHYFKDPKFQLLPPINPKKSHISLRVLPVALMILGEKSHVETRCNGEAISWENSSFRSGNHCTITLQFLFHSHSKLNPSWSRGTLASQCLGNHG